MTPADNYPPPGRAWYMVGVLFIAYLLSFVDRQIITLLVGPIRSDLDITDFQFSLLHGLAFALFYALLGLPLGRAADRYNRRNLIVAGIALWSAMTALCGLARSFPQLFLARMGVGVGEAALSPAAYSMISDAFPAHQLTRAIAVYTAGGTLGTGIALLIGGAVIQLVGDANTVSVPLIGELRPWQTAFLLVGLPGLAVAALMATVIEPARRGLLRTSLHKTNDLDTQALPSGAADVQPVSIGEAVRFLLHRRETYGTLFLVTAAMTALSSGFIAWYPTFLIRLHGFDMSGAGYTFGMLFLVFGTAGVMAGSSLATYLATKGYEDANLRVMVIAASMALLPYVLGPLMPNTTAALACMALSVFSTQMIGAVCIAATQLITPNQLRGQASAVFLLLVNLIGFGVGATLIAACTDFLFASDTAIHYAMALTAGLIVPPAIYYYWRALPAYRRAIVQSRQWLREETRLG